MEFWGKLLAFCFLVALGILFLATIHNPLFWDSILLSGQYGTFYYLHFGRSLFVPAEMAGYPPLWGYYIALMWKLADRSLLTSHVAMLPWILIFIFQVNRAVHRSVDKIWRSWVWVLVLVEPVWLAQSTQVAPDLALIALFWLIFNDLEDRHWLRSSMVMCLLLLLSPRGLLAAVGLLFYAVIQERQNRAWLWVFLPPVLVAGSWYFIHKIHFGWSGYSSDNEWGGLFSIVSVRGFIKNVVVLVWRFLDQGRCIIFLVTGLIFWKRSELFSGTSSIWRLLACLAFVYFPAFLFFENGTGHRYLLPFTTLLILVSGQVISRLQVRSALLAFAISALGLLSGHFWVYPEPIANGWDSTLAHLPYFDLKNQALEELKMVRPQSVGTDFPNLRPVSEEYLKITETTLFKPKALRSDSLVLYSNVFNGFSEADRDTLKNHYQLQNAWKMGSVKMELYCRVRE